jgi:glyoxylase-like metal-dependent hydrolase (beta-lactamase superfamily II)
VAQDAYALIDPLVRDDLDPTAWDWLDQAVAAAGLPVTVLLTAAWHERSARAIVQRCGASVWASPRARGRFPELPQLGRTPSGVRLFEPRGVDEGQVAFVLDDDRTIFVGEFLLGSPTGLRVLPSPATRDLAAFIDSLRELQSFPLVHVLVSHGDPVLANGRDEIAAALARFGRD